MKQLESVVENKVDVVGEGVRETSDEITARIRKLVQPDVHEAFDVGDVEVVRVTPPPFKRWRS